MNSHRPVPFAALVLILVTTVNLVAGWQARFSEGLGDRGFRKKP